jgi:hypothetical protein
LQNGTIIYTDTFVPLTEPAPVGYYSDGTNWWYVSGVVAGELTSETICFSGTSTTTTTTTAAPTTTTSTTTTTTTSVATIDLATNNSLDIAISISGITVNGVSVTNITGIDPNTTGNGGGAQTTQIGTYTIVIPYSASTAGQSISLIDSDSVPQCQGTSTGSGVLTFTGVVVGVLQPVTITANEGACPA